MTAPGSRRTSSRESSTHSSRPSQWATTPGSVSTSRAESFAGTTGRSRYNRGPGTPNSASRSRRSIKRGGGERVAELIEIEASVDELVERLATHKTLGSAPREELEWLASHGRLRGWAQGGVMVPQSSVVSEMVIMFTGHAAIYVERAGTGRRKIMEWFGGD